MTSSPNAPNGSDDKPGSGIKALILDVARALVDDGNGVEVREIAGTTTTVYELSVAKNDVGKIIGRNGRTLRAFRTIVSAVGTKLNRKSILEVLE